VGLLSRAALKRLGFAQIGRDVRVSDRASFHGVDRIALGDHVRIDDFVVMSAGVGGIRIGHHVHVAVYTSLIGAGCITLEDFSNLSARVCIYSSSDDYSGAHMTNPMVPPEFTGVQHADVRVGRHVIIGAGSVVLPGVVLAEGVAVGALSLINRDCAPFTIHAGTPARQIGERSRALLELEKRFLASQGG
jgi:galactoside O-acetyltransferase